MKSTASRLRKAKDREDDQSYGSNVDQRFFHVANFSISVALNEMMPHVLKDHESWATDDGSHVMVLNPNEMISTTALMTKASTWVLKP
jgi:hypothetical protein